MLYKVPQLLVLVRVPGPQLKHDYFGGHGLKRLRTTGIHYLSLGIAHRSKRPVIELNYCYIVLEIGLNILEKFWKLIGKDVWEP